MMKNNKILKGIAGAVAIILIIAILVVTNAFVGNPISAARARHAAKKHIEERYSFLNLEAEKPVYNFKNSEYIINVYSNSSIDTHFSIYYRGGDIHDDYETMVLDKFNTISRLTKEYSNLVTSLLADELGYKNNRSYVNYQDDIYENTPEYIELDMQFDRNLPISVTVSMDIEAQDPSLEKMANILRDAHKVFQENGCIFEKYDLMAGNDTIYNIHGVKTSQIEDGNLLEMFQQSLESKGDEFEGVIIFIREEK